MGGTHDTRDAPSGDLEQSAEPRSAVSGREFAPPHPMRGPSCGSGGLSPELVLRLQRSAGNSAASALIQREARPRPAAPARPTAPPRRAIARGFWGRLWHKVKHVASAAWSGVKGAASDVWEGAKALGSHVVEWVKTAGSKVVDAIKWFGAKAWDVIKVIGTVAWEKLSLLGTLAWTFLSNLPVRLWRLVIDAWDAVVGTLSWGWDGLKGAAGWAWDAAVGAFSWLGEGVTGALRWLGSGLENGAEWAVDFVSSPSLDKLRDGLLGTLSWLGDGVKGLGRWGWQGVASAAAWAWSGLKGLGSWLFDGLIGGLEWCGQVAIHLLGELTGFSEALQLVWGLAFRLRKLTDAERQASESVHPPGLIPYWKVRVDENSYLIKIGQKLADLFSTKTSPAAITTMHIIHAPSSLTLPVAVHELTHVGQYEKVGAMYMPQALHGQGSTDSYKYGNLTAKRRAKKRFADFNREQQASICEDYYRVSNGMTAEYGASKRQLEPFIADMRAGEF